MTFIPDPKRPKSVFYDTPAPDLPYWFWPTFWLVGAAALIAWGTVSLLGFLGGLLAGAAAGFVIGWLRQAFSRRSRFGESLISALFGAGLGREPLRAVVFDLLLRALVGYAVGLVFARIGVVTPELADIWERLLVGGSGGGPDPSGLALVVGLLLVLAMLLGLVIGLILGKWAEAVLYNYLLDPKGLARTAVEGAAQEMVENASAQWRHWDRQTEPGPSAAKGAVTGALVGLLLIGAELYGLL